MNRDEAKEIFEKSSDSAINYLDSTDVISVNSSIIILDEIYDNFETQLKEKDAEITRLRSQISRGHDSQCSCSFCKPSFIFGEPDVHETTTTEKN